MTHASSFDTLPFVFFGHVGRHFLGLLGLGFLLGLNIVIIIVRIQQVLVIFIALPRFLRVLFLDAYRVITHLGSRFAQLCSYMQLGSKSAQLYIN